MVSPMVLGRKLFFFFSWSQNNEYLITKKYDSDNRLLISCVIKIQH